MDILISSNDSSLFSSLNGWNTGFAEEREGAPSQRSRAKTTGAGIKTLTFKVPEEK